MLGDKNVRLGGGYSEQFLVPLDVLDVSVSRRIEGYTVRLATAVREEVVPGGRVIYRLSWREFGRIGEVELHKVDTNATWLTVRNVQPLDKDLREKIRSHMDMVIRALRAGLAEDAIWEKHGQALERRGKAAEPEHNRSGWELTQSFNFNADAAAVCAYIMGSDNWQEENYREIDVTDGHSAMHAILSAGRGIKALYSIAILADIQDGTAFAHDKGERFLMRPSTDVGVIELLQESPGKCTGQLYIEMNPERLGSDHTSSESAAPGLVSQLWHDLVNDWLDRKQVNRSGAEATTVESQTAKPPTSETPASNRLVPSRDADKRKWKAVWARIKSRVDQSTNLQISEWLKKMHPHLPNSPDTIRKIIKAGENGLLD